MSPLIILLLEIRTKKNKEQTSNKRFAQFIWFSILTTFQSKTLGEKLDIYVTDYKYILSFFDNNIRRYLPHDPHKETTILGEELDDFLREFVSSVHTEDQVFK